MPYPTSCSPQAWAAATPVLLLRTLLRFDPDVPQGRAWLAPAVPAGFPDLTLHHLPLAGAWVELELAGGQVRRLDGMPTGLEVVREPRVAGARGSDIV